MKKKKLLHITSSLKMGGAEAVLCDLIHNLNEFEHHVIYFHNGTHRMCLEKLGIAIYHIQGAISLYDPFFFKQLYTKVKTINPDGIHSLLWAANVASRIIGNLLKIPVMCAMHNNKEQDGFLRNCIERATIHLSTTIIAVSEQVSDSLKTHIPSTPSNKVVVIPNGISWQNIQLSNKKEGVTRSELGLDNNNFIVGSVGRFMPVKRYDLLIDAFAIFHKKYPQSRLILIGLGDLEETLRKKAQTLGISDVVIFIIAQPGYRYYSLFDCFAQPSDKEGVSIALLEAMSFGLPCIVTGQPYHPVIKNGVNGIVIPPGDMTHLTACFEQIIIDKTAALELGMQAKKTVADHFCAQKMYTLYKKTFFANCV